MRTRVSDDQRETFSLTVPDDRYGEAREILADGLFNHRKDGIGRSIDHGSRQCPTAFARIDGHDDLKYLRLSASVHV